MGRRRSPSCVPEAHENGEGIKKRFLQLVCYCSGGNRPEDRAEVFFVHEFLTHFRTPTPTSNPRKKKTAGRALCQSQGLCSVSQFPFLPRISLGLSPPPTFIPPTSTKYHSPAPQHQICNRRRRPCIFLRTHSPPYSTHPRQCSFGWPYSPGLKSEPTYCRHVETFTLGETSRQIPLRGTSGGVVCVGDVSGMLCYLGGQVAVRILQRVPRSFESSSRHYVPFLYTLSWKISSSLHSLSSLWRFAISRL